MKRKIKDVFFNILDRFAENYSLSISDNERSRTDGVAYTTINDVVEDRVTKKQFRDYYETAKWKKMNGIFLIMFLIAFSISFVSASSVSVWQGQYYTGTTFNTGTYIFNFTVYDSLIGGNNCFSNATSLTTGNWGEWKTEQAGVGDSCNNASEEYFLNINIDGTDQSPRRRLVIWDFLRRDVEEAKDGNLVVSDNITADYYFGDGSFLTNLASGSLGVSVNTTEIENGQVWTVDIADGNVTDVKIFNLSWGKLVSVPIGLADGDNDTTYSHLTNFTDDLGDRGYTHLTNFTDDILWTSVFNSTGDSRWGGSIDTQKNTSGNYLYNDSATIYFNESRLNLTIESFNYLISYTETDPLWSANFSLYNSSWSLDTDTNYYNSTGLDLNTSNYFSIFLGYRLPQSCNDGEIAEYNSSSGGWDCAIDNSAASGMASWILVADDTGSSEAITDGETVTFADDNKYLNTTRVTSTITYSINEVELNKTIDARDNDTTYSHLTNFTDDLGDRGYTHLTNFTDDVLWTSAFNLTGDSRWGGNIDTQKNTSGNYLYNDSTTIYFNESRLNLTIDLRSTGGDNSSWNESYADTKYLQSETDPLWSANFSLYNSSWSLDTQKGTSGDYLYNDSSLIYFNDTLLNDTIDIRSNGGTYLNLSGTNADQDINITPYNFETSNLSLTQKITFALGEIVDNVVDGWVRITGGLNVTGDIVVQGNVTVEGIFLEQDSANHIIYDNSSCVIIKGDTSTMYIC